MKTRDGNPNAYAKPDKSDILGTRILMQNYIADSALLISMTKVTLDNFLSKVK